MEKRLKCEKNVTVIESTRLRGYSLNVLTIKALVGKRLHELLLGSAGRDCLQCSQGKEFRAQSRLGWKGCWVSSVHHGGKMRGCWHAWYWPSESLAKEAQQHTMCFKMCTLWFHGYEDLKQTKLIYGDGSQKSGSQGQEVGGLLTEKGKRELFWAWEYSVSWSGWSLYRCTHI